MSLLESIHQPDMFTPGGFACLVSISLELDAQRCWGLGRGLSGTAYSPS